MAATSRIGALGQPEGQLISLCLGMLLLLAWTGCALPSTNSGTNLHNSAVGESAEPDQPGNRQFSQRLSQRPRFETDPTRFVTQTSAELVMERVAPAFTAQPDPGGLPSTAEVGHRSSLDVPGLLPSDTTPAPVEPEAIGRPAEGEIASLSVGIDEAIRLCLANDPQLRAGLEGIRQAEAEQITASLRPNPELEFLQSLLPLGQRFIADEREGGPPQLDIFMAYPVDWFLFGKRAAAMVAAARGQEVSVVEYADLVRQRVLETAVAYYDVLEAQGLLDLARQDVANLERVEELTRIAVENGARPEVELQRIQLDLLGSRQTLRESQRDVAVARAAFQAMLGRSLEDREYHLAGTLDEPLLDLQIDFRGALLLADVNRPDIQGLRRSVAQARAEMEVERREGFAEVTPQIGYTRQFQRKAIDFPDANSWGIGVATTLPWNDWNQGNRRRAASVFSQANYELEAGLVELRAEIEQAIEELLAAESNSELVAGEQLRLAESVRDRIIEAFEIGGRTLLEVLDAQQNFRETYRNYITTRADYWRAVHRFQAAVGAEVLR